MKASRHNEKVGMILLDERYLTVTKDYEVEISKEQSEKVNA